jgi:hypothetical protein
MTYSDVEVQYSTFVGIVSHFGCLNLEEYGLVFVGSSGVEPRSGLTTRISRTVPGPFRRN